MDSAKLNEWIQVIGIFALVASLIFVGFQMQQTHKIALADQYQSRAQTTIDYLLVRMQSDYGNPRYPAQIRWLLMDNNHFQYQQGFLTNETWQGYANFIRDLYARCQDRLVFEDRKSLRRASFVEFVESHGGSCVEDQ